MRQKKLFFLVVLQQLVEFLLVQHFIERVCGSFLFVVVLDIFQGRVAVFFLVAIQEYLTVLVLAVFIQRKERDILLVANRVNGQDRSL